MTRPGPNVTSDADTQPGSDSLFPTGFSGGGALVRQGSVGTGEIADGSVASGDLNLSSVASALAARSEFTGTYAQPASATDTSGVRLPFFGVRDPQFGAKGDGVADDTATIQAAIDAAATFGAAVYLPGGTFRAKGLLLKSGVTLLGAGEGATTLKLVDGANVDLVTTPNFATLAGSNSTGGETQFALRDLTLDGNGSNQTATSWTFRVYGYNYRVQRVTFQNGRDGNVYSEWSNNGAGNMESFWDSFKIRTPTGAGAVNLDWRGPHDSHFVSGEVVSGTSNLAQYGIWSRGNAGAEVFAAVHVWGFHTVGWTQEHSCLATVCEIEGALTNLSVLASQVRWQGWLFGTSGSRSNEIGLSLGQGVTNCDIDVQMFAFSNAASGRPLVYGGTGSGGKNRITGAVNGYGANAVASGTTNATDYIALYNGDSVQNGAQNQPSPQVIQVNSGSAFIIRKPIASGLRFNWDTTSTPEKAQTLSGAISAWYSDQGSTETARIDSATGNVGVGMTTFSGVKVVAIGNGTIPSANPTAGGYLYVEAGALKYRGSSGTITVIAPA